MANELKIQCQAQITNLSTVTQELQDALKKGLIIDSGSIVTKHATKGLAKAQSYYNQGDVYKALGEVEKVAVSLAQILVDTATTANGVTSDLATKLTKLVEANKAYQHTLLNDPTLKYNKRANNQYAYTADYVREQLKQQGIGLTRNGKAWEVEFNGQSAVVGGTGQVNEFAKALLKLNLSTDQLTALLKSIGFHQDPNNTGKVIADDLAQQREAEIAQHEQELNDRLATVQQASIDVKEARINLPSASYDGDNGAHIDTGNELDKVLDIATNASRGQQEAAKQQVRTAQTIHAANEEYARQYELQRQLSKSTTQLTDVQNKNTSSVSRAVTTFFGYQMVLRQLRRLWREAITTITELDKQLTTQAMVTGMTREQTWQLVESYQEIAQATGLAQTTIAGVTTEYLRQGETLQNALTLTKAAAAAATVAGIDASESVRYLTTAIHGFKLEAEDALAVSDKFAALAAQAATNYEDLAIALSKVASQAALAGMSMDYTLALLTTGLDVTQEAPESIGTALKTVIARMREISDYGKTLEDDVDINQVESGLRAVNIALKDGTGELRSTEEVLDELGRKWSTLSANQQAAVAKALAGTRQQSRLVAIMENYDKVLDYQNTAMTSIGATTAQQVTYLEGMEAAVNNLRSTYQSLIKSLISSQEAINVVNMLRDALEWVGSFLKQPAGRWALLSVIINVLTRSKELMDRIKMTVDQLVRTLSQVREENEKIIKQQQTQLQQEQNKLAIAEGQKGKHAVNYSSASRPNGWLSNIASESTAADMIAGVSSAAFKTLLKLPTLFSKAGRESVSRDWSRVAETRESWWQNNSLVGKVHSRQADKNAINTAINNFHEQEKKLPQELQKVTQAIEQYNKQLKELQASDQPDINEDGALSDVQEKIKENENKRLEIEKQITDFREGERAQDLKVYQSKLPIEDKIEYLANQRLLKAKENTLESTKQKLNSKDISAEERQQLLNKQKETEESIKQLENSIKETRNKVATNNGKITGTNISQLISRASAIVAAASTAISWIQEIVDIGQNYAKQLASQALENSKRIQAEMYQNTQLKSTIASSAETIKKFSTQIVKTTDDLKELETAQGEFAEAVGLSTEEIKAMSAQQIDDLAYAKQLKLDEKNAELAEELNKTLTEAGGADSFGTGLLNVLGKTGMGVGLGAGVTAGSGNVAVIAAGAIIGGVVGLATGIAEQIQKGVIAADAKNKINALLETSEGVEQFKYALKLNYKAINDATVEGGGKMKDALSAMFSSVVELLDADDLKEILNKYNYNMVEFANHFNELLQGDLEAVRILSDDNSNIKERVKAAQQIERSTRDDKEINDAFRKVNSRYLDIGDKLDDFLLDFVTDAGWTITDVSNVINSFGTDTNGLRQALMSLKEWLDSGATSTEGLEDAVKNLNSEETKAIQDMITGGKQLQDVADINTRNRSQVASFRETQAKWMSMSESDQQRFINDNLDFFADPEAARKFFNGEDIYNELKKYQADIQAESLEMYEQQRQSLLIQLAKAEADGDEALVKTTKALLNVIDKRIDSVEHMFDLTWEDVVNKEQQQIAKIKEMYQAEEEALTESLNKRKEAYQRYFDQLDSMESAQDYAEKRNQLISSISSLAGGTDATSRNQINNLRKQLQQAEEEEAKRRRQKAREAVIQNIDDQVTQISEKFNELLSNNKALLDTLNASTEAQYFMWLANSGATEAEQELARQQLGDLLQGKWGTNGLERFTNPEVTPPSVTDVQVDKTNNTFNLDINGGSQSISMNQDQMNRLLSRILDAVQEITGQRISMGGR